MLGQTGATKTIQPLSLGARYIFRENLTLSHIYNYNYYPILVITHLYHKMLKLEMDELDQQKHQHLTHYLVVHFSAECRSRDKLQLPVI